MINDKTLNELIQLKTSDHVIVFNDCYECRFVSSNDKIFSEFKKDDNCQMMSSSADVIVYDKQENKKNSGQIMINLNQDLSCTMTVYLMLFDDNGDKKSMINAVNIEIQNNGVI